MSAAAKVPIRHRPNRFSPLHTKEILRESEALLWNLADLNRAIEDADGSWDYPEETRAFVLAAIEEAEAELARRQRVRHLPEAPPWPDRWPDDRGELDRIKRALPLARFVEQMFPGTRFERRGRELVCSCVFPDHDDPGPSFCVNEEKGVWLCRGCQRGGDIFTLAMMYSGTPYFADVLPTLAREANLADPRGEGASGG